jgi:hypothetical protein
MPKTPNPVSKTNRQAGWFAIAAGIIGLVWVTCLGLFYATEITTDGPFIWGPIGDVATVIYNLLILPVLWRISILVSKVIWWIIFAFTIVVVVCTALMILGSMPFGIATGFLLVGILAQAVWFVLINRLLLKRENYPVRFGWFGLSAGAAVLIGFAIFEWGLILPQFIQPLSIVGVTVGVIGWLSMPIWFLLAGGKLRRGEIG